MYAVRIVFGTEMFCICFPIEQLKLGFINSAWYDTVSIFTLPFIMKKSNLGFKRTYIVQGGVTRVKI
jgi:hypothetical protein